MPSITSHQGCFFKTSTTKRWQEHLNTCPPMMGVQNGAATLDNTLAVFYMVKLHAHHTTRQTHTEALPQEN